jgi:hypothetical protein
MFSGHWHARAFSSFFTSIYTTLNCVKKELISTSMDKVLRPERFDTRSPNAQDASKAWRHWLATFENFVAAIPGERVNKLNVLINYVSSDVYELFCETATYVEAINLLKSLYVKTPNEIFARHKLATQKQQPGESLDEYLQELKILSKDCN